MSKIESPKPFTMLEHTGDIKMRVYGKNTAEIFAHAAQGMMEYLYGENLEKIPLTSHQAIALSSEDRESLLLDWLSELLYLSAVNACAYRKFDISEISATRLKATVYGGVAQALDEIKAVTYHELHIAQKNEHYEAEIVFDI